MPCLSRTLVVEKGTYHGAEATAAQLALLRRLSLAGPRWRKKRVPLIKTALVQFFCSLREREVVLSGASVPLLLVVLGEATVIFAGGKVVPSTPGTPFVYLLLFLGGPK